jgi:hypothetical protein
VSEPRLAIVRAVTRDGRQLGSLRKVADGPDLSRTYLA